MKTAIILATSREGGNTHQLVNLYLQHQPCDLFNLNDYAISPYDYQHNNQNDDFITLIKALVKYDHLIFATPVYWYAMSAQMKLFFDRLSDLLTIEKALGRALNGKSCSIFATGSDAKEPDCFIEPFKLSAQYFGIKYTDILYCCCRDNFIVEEHIAKVESYLLMEHQNGAR